MKFSFFKNNLINIFWRISRKILSISRNENQKDPRKNGEYWIINNIIKINTEENKGVFFDVGAFKGEWTLNLKKSLGKKYINNQIY